MFLHFIIILPGVVHDQWHHSLHMVTKPVPSLPTDGAQRLDVGPRGGQVVTLAQLLHQHVDQLDVQASKRLHSNNLMQLFHHT